MSSEDKEDGFTGSLTIEGIDPKAWFMFLAAHSDSLRYSIGHFHDENLTVSEAFNRVLLDAAEVVYKGCPDIHERMLKAADEYSSVCENNGRILELDSPNGLDRALAHFARIAAPGPVYEDPKSAKPDTLMNGDYGKIQHRWTNE